MTLSAEPTLIVAYGMPLIDRVSRTTALIGGRAKVCGHATDTVRVSAEVLDDLDVVFALRLRLGQLFLEVGPLAVGDFQLVGQVR